MVAIDRDTVSDDPVDPSDTPEPAHGDYAAVEPGAADVAELGSIPPADVATDLVSDGRAPPIGVATRRFPARWSGDPTHCLGPTMEPAPSQCRAGSVALHNKKN